MGGLPSRVREEFVADIVSNSYPNDSLRNLIVRSQSRRLYFEVEKYQLYQS